MLALLTLLGCAGERPSNLGAVDGRLGTCPDTPNCVSSAETRQNHQIAPLEADIAQIRSQLLTMPGAQIIREEDQYLYAEFTSSLMGFVDDVEFLEQDGRTQVRSASRLGKSDLGVNRKRIETIRQALKDADAP